MPKPIRSAGYRSATHTGYSAQARHSSAAQLVSLEFADSTYEDKWYRTHKSAGAVRYNVQKGCAAQLCRALRRVNRLCSSTLSVNCKYFTKDTQE